MILVITQDLYNCESLKIPEVFQPYGHYPPTVCGTGGTPGQ